MATSELESKKAAKALNKARQRELAKSNPPQEAPVQDPFKKRSWLRVRPSAISAGSLRMRCTILSWNLLAQALVRRTLFPGCDNLRAKDRVPYLMQEVLYYKPDIACLQEVDRIDEHMGTLEKQGNYGHVRFIGYDKKEHGLVIAYRNDAFTNVGVREFRLDETELFPSSVVPLSSAEASEASAAPAAAFRETYTGLSHATRNVGLIVALESKERAGNGIIVATGHLYWHGKSTYERTRQLGLIIKEMKLYRNAHPEWAHWDAVIAGDLNSQPIELTYAFALGHRLTSTQLKSFQTSAVVDGTVRDKVAPEVHEELRTASLDELKSLYAKDEQSLLEALKDEKQTPQTGIRSAYGENYGLIESEANKWYSSRLPKVYSTIEHQDLMAEKKAAKEAKGEVAEDYYASDDEEDITEEEYKRRHAERTWEDKIQYGSFEPIWTNFTPLWRCTLDYILILPRDSATVSSHPAPVVTQLLEMHTTADLEPGLPRKGVEPSDHIAVGAELEWY